MSDMQTNILLESGTNELEIMEFTIDGKIFGINVAKVTEIMTISPITTMPKSHPVIEGIFKPREQVITVIDLSKYLGLGESENPDKDIFIITRFNQLDFAFHVHSVVGIDRISWTMLQKPDDIIYGGEEGVATAIADFQERLITILDFEKIVTEISVHAGIQISDLDVLGSRVRQGMPILVVDDSMLLSKMILDALHKAGYANTVKMDNGQEAWDYLCEVKQSGDPILSHISCVITDIEMPQMDGHRLTKLIKDDKDLKVLPVILFSSLIDEEMRKKGADVGADAQITKPEILGLVTLIDQLVGYDSHGADLPLTLTPSMV
ncbi:MAG: chemotaxis protein [Clostridiales bacterium]|nr:chemotaxis protein [Clostridiales bacterium]